MLQCLLQLLLVCHMAASHSEEGSSSEYLKIVERARVADLHEQSRREVVCRGCLVSLPPETLPSHSQAV